MRAGEVLDMQGDLFDRLENPKFCEVLDTFGDLEYGRSGGYKKEHTTPLSLMLHRNLRVAHTFRVTHDMSMLVQHAADGLDELDRFDYSLAPTGAGFVAFDRPLPIIDQRGRTMLVHYLTWGPAMARFGGPASEAQSCTLFTMFNDQWREPDQVASEMLADYVQHGINDGHSEDDARTMAPVLLESFQSRMGRWAAVGSQAAFFEQRLGPAMAMPHEKEQAKLLAEGVTPHEGTNALRYVHALWLMMEQTVARKDPEHVERHAAKRHLRRMKVPAKVTVVKLRRESGGEREHGESDVEWAHRWVVRGHWRWAHVGPHHALAQEIAPGDYRARIWINPHVKGPADKPIHQTEKVYSLER